MFLFIIILMIIGHVALYVIFTKLDKESTVDWNQFAEDWLSKPSKKKKEMDDYEKTYYYLGGKK